MNQKNTLQTVLYSALGVGIMLVVVIAVNVIGGVIKARVDLTDSKAYTLTDGTKAILQKLDTQVEIRFYCTRDDSAMPVPLRNYAKRIEDLLTEYKQQNGRFIEIKKFDPAPDSDAEDSATLDGIEGQMISMTDKIYLGLAVSCVDSKATLPFLTPDRERLLEYDISRAISSVTKPTKAVVGVMSGLPVFGQQNQMMMMRQPGGARDPWIFVSELKRDFDVKEVDSSVEKIDDDVSVLVVVHPKNMTDKTMYAIDQFVLRGGKLIAFLDPFSVVDARSSQQQAMMMQQPPAFSNMDKLLTAWGLKFDTGKILADINYQSRVPGRNGQAENAPTVLTIPSEGINKDDVVGGALENLVMFFAGTISGTPKEGLEQTVLVKSTTKSQLVESFLVQMGGDAVTRDFKASETEQNLAVRLTGKFKTAFPDGKPKDAAPEGEKDKAAAAPDANALKESTTDGVVILCGDVDMLYDEVAGEVVQPLGQKMFIPRTGNLNFLQGAVEQLAGDTNLISVRSRATKDRSFKVVKKMQAEADQKFQDELKKLEKDLADAQQRINELQRGKTSDQQKFVLSPEQQAEIKNFQKKEADTKKNLKQRRKELRKEIDSLETNLKLINIALMPFLVAGLGVAIAIVKSNRRAAK